MSLGEDIRWVFAGFLFAFVVSEIAKRFAELLADWKARDSDRGISVLHLVYTLAIVVMSWWGWSTALSIGVYAEPATERSIFRYTTMLFLIDIALLVFYYALLLGMKHIREDARLRSIRYALFWTAIIFGGYLLWDALLALRPVDAPRFGVWQHACVSAIGAALALAAYFLIGGTKRITASSVYGTYAALLFLLLAFRLMKVTIPWTAIPTASGFFWLSLASIAAFLSLAAFLRLR